MESSVGNRGVASIIAAIFMVVMILFLSFTVFTFTLFKNTQFQDTVNQLNQIDVEQTSELISFSQVNFTRQENGSILVKAQLKNESPVSVHILTLWVVQTGTEKYGYEDKLNILLTPGEIRHFERSVAAVAIAESGPIWSGWPISSREFSAWFITARGNRIPIPTEKVLLSQVSGGIGSINMDFDSFKFYYRHPNYTITPWDEGIRSFQVPSGENLVFAILLSNLDPDGRKITLHSNSLMHIYSPKSSSQAYAEIVNIDAGEVITPFERIDLVYGQTDWIFFKIDKIEGAFAGKPCAVNLMLIGTIGDEDYGQNIPFVSIYVT